MPSQPVSRRTVMTSVVAFGAAGVGLAACSAKGDPQPVAVGDTIPAGGASGAEASGASAGATSAPAGEAIATGSGPGRRPRRVRPPPRPQPPPARPPAPAPATAGRRRRAQHQHGHGNEHQHEHQQEHQDDEQAADVVQAADQARRTRPSSTSTSTQAGPPPGAIVKLSDIPVGGLDHRRRDRRRPAIVELGRRSLTDLHPPGVPRQCRWWGSQLPVPRVEFDAFTGAVLQRSGDLATAARSVSVVDGWVVA